MGNNFQRRGAISNAHVGREFEEIARQHFQLMEGLELSKQFELLVGLGSIKKPRRFDLGTQYPPVIVECKSMTWTEGGRSPSAKLNALREAMVYFHLAPSEYRKILFMLRSERAMNPEPLADYFVRTNGHFVPPDVEILEYDESTKLVRAVFPSGVSFDSRGERQD